MKHFFAVATFLLIACSQETPLLSTTGGALDNFFAAAPEGPSVTVLEARKNPVAGSELVLRGRVKDFVRGRAAFSVIDPSLIACSDEGDPMEGACETPWDYCCVPSEERAAASAMVELRNEQGVIKESAQGFRGLDHLDTVVARGTVELDANGNLTLVARSLSFTKNVPTK
jgi:hypothetical protein